MIVHLLSFLLKQILVFYEKNFLLLMDNAFTKPLTLLYSIYTIIKHFQDEISHYLQKMYPIYDKLYLKI